MKSFVITLTKNEKSCEAASRCIGSAKHYGVNVEIHKAYTPKNVDGYFLNNNIPSDNFNESWSRTKNAMACFASHHSLWRKAIALDENILILEHDAVFNRNAVYWFLTDLSVKGILNLGKPSYGNFLIPDKQPGIYPLFSKSRGAYLGGAHAYIVSPNAAIKLIEKSQTEPYPTDIFLSNKRFDFIEEIFPWPIEAQDTFTTVQTEKGCLAKHNYNKDYEII